MESCVYCRLLQKGSEWVTTSRKMKWSRLAALMVKAINEFLFAKVEERKDLGDLAPGDIMIMKWILKKYILRF